MIEPFLKHLGQIYNLTGSCIEFHSNMEVFWDIKCGFHKFWKTVAFHERSQLDKFKFSFKTISRFLSKLMRWFQSLSDWIQPDIFMLNNLSWTFNKCQDFLCDSLQYAWSCSLKLRFSCFDLQRQSFCRLSWHNSQSGLVKIFSYGNSSLKY